VTTPPGATPVEGARVVEGTTDHHTHRPTHHYGAVVTWEGSTGVGYDAYDRSHTGATVPPTVDVALSSDPAFGGDPTRLDPEQLLVLAAASCQLLSFLAVCARGRVDVVSYRDDAQATMPEIRPVRIATITLRPHILIRLGDADDEGSVRSRVERFVEVAHRECYIASSITSDVSIEPEITLIR
jgi:organic hydroperoxide reductase OsmC/OhrA